jgi:hypothetical protein
LNEDPQRALRREAEQLASLGKVGSFLLLMEKAEGRRRRDREFLFGLVNSDTQATVLQRQADYQRGFSDGMLYLERVVSGAERRLEAGELEDREEEVRDIWNYG